MPHSPKAPRPLESEDAFPEQTSTLGFLGHLPGHAPCTTATAAGGQRPASHTAACASHEPGRALASLSVEGDHGSQAGGGDYTQSPELHGKAQHTENSVYFPAACCIVIVTAVAVLTRPQNSKKRATHVD